MALLSLTATAASIGIAPVEIMRQCPRFAGCSVNHCPLDPEQDRHRPHPRDRCKVCPMEKQVRQRIGAKYPDALPRGGLTRQEHAGGLRWSKLGSAERSAIAEVGRRGLAKWRATATTGRAGL